MFEQLHMFAVTFESALPFLYRQKRTLQFVSTLLAQLMMLVCVFGFLSACSLVNVKSQNQNSSIVDLGPEHRKAMQRQQRIERLLKQAESALLRGRLTLPENDNAYDRYRAVLMIEPHNVEAKKGLKRILNRYVARVHLAASSGQIPQAKQIIKQMQQYYSQDPLIAVMKTRLEKESRTLAKKASQSTVMLSKDDTLLLPARALSQKNDSMKEILTKVAHRIRESDEGIIIHARTDAEGRWIYQTMKQAIDGYRIRGDIRVKSKPAIVFIHPF